MVAVSLERAERCTMCGTASYEWEEDPFAYEAVRVSCPGCMRRETLQEDSGESALKGVSVRLHSAAMAERARVELERKTAEGTLRPKRRRE